MFVSRKVPPVPHIALGIATGGGSIGTQILISAATQAADKFISGKQLNAVVPELLPAAALGYLTIKAGFHIESLTRAGKQTFGEFASAMRADAAKAKINLSGETIESLYRAKASELKARADEVGIARSKLTARTDKQLKADTDRTVRAGETVNRAQARAIKSGGRNSASRNLKSL